MQNFVSIQPRTSLEKSDVSWHDARAVSLSAVQVSVLTKQWLDQTISIDPGCYRAVRVSLQFARYIQIYLRVRKSNI